MLVLSKERVTDSQKRRCLSWLSLCGASELIRVESTLHCGTSRWLLEACMEGECGSSRSGGERVGVKMQSEVGTQKSERPWPGGSVGWRVIPYTERLRVQRLSPHLG